MAKPRDDEREIEGEYLGKRYTGGYSFRGGAVTVHSFSGSKTTQIGGSSAEPIARILLTEIVVENVKA